MKSLNIVDGFLDAVSIAMIGGLFGLCAFAWKEAGFGVARTLFLMFAAAYQAGRWHATRRAERRFRELRGQETKP